VSGAAWTTDASRLATTPASRVELTVAFVDIAFLQRLEGIRDGYVI
jgi:hypothetical protein